MSRNLLQFVNIRIAVFALIVGMTIIPFAAAEGGFHPSSVPASDRDPTFRDPTLPPAQLLQTPTAEKNEVAFQLDSILISSFRQVAVINGRRVVVGDNVGDARVTHIQPDHVRLSNSKKSFRLTRQESPGIRRQAK